MALIGEIVTKITVDNKKVTSELKKTQRQFINFGKMSEKALKGIKAGMVGLTLATAGFIASMKKSADEVDNLAKTSSKLGIATEELQRLRFQAQLTGVEAGTLDMALQRMVRRVAEAAKGTGEAKDALKELGLNAQQLAQLSPDQQFNRIASAMKNVQNQTDRVRLAFKLFDSEGVALVNTLTSDLEKTRKEFNQLGIALSQQEAARVEKFNDSITKIGTIFSGISNKIMSALAPSFEFLTQKLITFLKEGGADRIKNSIVRGFDTLVNIIQSVAHGIKVAQGAFSEFFTFVDSKISPLINKLQGFGEAVSEIYKGMKMRFTDFFETASQFNVGALNPFQFGAQAGQQKQFFKDPVAAALAPTAIPANAGGAQPKIQIEVTSDTDAVIKRLLMNREAEDWIDQLFSKETSQIGR